MAILVILVILGGILLLTSCVHKWKLVDRFYNNKQNTFIYECTKCKKIKTEIVNHN